MLHFKLIAVSPITHKKVCCEPVILRFQVKNSDSHFPIRSYYLLHGGSIIRATLQALGACVLIVVFVNEIEICFKCSLRSLDEQ